jgi:DNA-binding NarL/FixJ family response regulator
VPKRATDTEVIDAIRRARRRPLRRPRSRRATRRRRGRPALEPLSERERDVLHLLALGYTNQESAKLFISARTVDTHRAHIMRKLQLKTRAELVLFALSNGLIGAT